MLTVFVILSIVAAVGGGPCIGSSVVNWICGTDDGFGDGFGLIVFRHFRWRW